MAGRMQQSNFTHLRAHDEQLVRLGLPAERYFAKDPIDCLSKLECRHVPAREQIERQSCAILIKAFKGGLLPSELVA